MPKKSSEDKRQYVRARRVLAISFRLKKSTRKNVDTAWHLSTTDNMSAGGVGFYTDVDYRKGDTLEIAITMSGVLDIYSGLARVVRTEQKRNAPHKYIALKLAEQPVKRKSTKSQASPVKKKSLRSVKRI